MTRAGRRKGQTKNVCGGIMADGINVCKQPPGAGTDHKGFGRCSRHGGMTPTGQKRAAVIESKARAKEFGSKTSHMIDPADALRDELARTNALLEWARDMCQKIIERAEVNAKKPPTQRDERIPPVLDIITDAAFQGYHSVLSDERDRLVRIARASLDTNIAARKQALAEALAAVVIDCFHAMTRSIPDLTPVQLTAAQDTLKVELQTATERLLLTTGSNPGS